MAKKPNSYDFNQQRLKKKDKNLVLRLKNTKWNVKVENQRWIFLKLDKCKIENKVEFYVFFQFSTKMNAMAVLYFSSHLIFIAELNQILFFLSLSHQYSRNGPNHNLYIGSDIRVRYFFLIFLAYLFFSYAECFLFLRIFRRNFQKNFLK